MAPPRKRHGRQRTATPEIGLVAVAGDRVDIPPPAGGWLKPTRDAWKAYWASESAELVRDSHRPALRRLFAWMDQQERALRRAAKLRREALAEPFVEGSKGQPVANPLFAVAEACEREARDLEAKIVMLEDRFGLSPKAELQLGVSFQRRQNLEALNAQMWSAEGIDVDDDPRAIPGDPPADTA